MEKRKKRPAEKQNKKQTKPQNSAPVKNGSSDVVGKKTFWRGMASRVYTAAAIIVVTAALVWAFTAFFTVENIVVYGNSRYTVEEIVELSGVEQGDGLILLSRAKIRENIIGDGVYIEDVSVKKLLPDTVEITVTDKTVTAAFEANGAYWLISGSGTLLELTLTCPPEVTVIKGAKLVDSAPGRSFTCEDGAKHTMLKTLINALRENGLMEYIDLIDITETYQVVLTYDGAYDIVMGSAEKIAADVARIPTVLELARAEGKTSGCFDMRDGSVRYTPDRWKGNILS